jgi:hypothetical protein
MKNGAWRYFHPGDDYDDLQLFLDEHIGKYVGPKLEITDPADEVWIFNKRIRIVIDIFDE